MNLNSVCGNILLVIKCYKVKNKNGNILLSQIFFYINWTVLFFNEGGYVFVKPMRDRNCVTMLDPIYLKYGDGLTAVLSLGSLLIDLVLVPGTLVGLGTVSV